MKTDEIMALVHQYRRVWVQSDDTNVIAASHENLRSAIEAALKERESPPKAQPMSESDIQQMLVAMTDTEPCTEFEAIEFMVRYTERHHNITGE